MDKQSPDFLMHIYSTKNAGDLFENLNQILKSQLSFFGGQYEDCDVAIFPQDFFDPAKPVDFDNDNYFFDMVVVYEGKDSFNDACTGQVIRAKKFKAAFESLNCTVDVSFYFMLPDGSNPNKLFDPNVRFGVHPPNLDE